MEAITARTNTIGDAKRERMDEIVMLNMKAVKREVAPIVEKNPEIKRGFI